MRLPRTHKWIGWEVSIKARLANFPIDFSLPSTLLVWPCNKAGNFGRSLLSLDLTIRHFWLPLSETSVYWLIVMGDTSRNRIPTINFDHLVLLISIQKQYNTRCTYCHKRHWYRESLVLSPLKALVFCWRVVRLKKKNLLLPFMVTRASSVMRS